MIEVERRATEADGSKPCALVVLLQSTRRRERWDFNIESTSSRRALNPVVPVDQRCGGSTRDRIRKTRLGSLAELEALGLGRLAA